MKRKILNAGFLVVIVAISSASAMAASETAVFAGGCFWGVEAVFEHVKGVKSVVSGYTGGTEATADYGTVGDGETGHAEAVIITFDPAVVRYDQLLFIFFAVAHDPTQKDRQGPDVGRQYRSAIFYQNEAQKTAALAFIKAIDASKALAKPVVTEVVEFKAFYPAEKYHQNYVRRNPEDGYVVYNDLPKIADLKKKFPKLYVEKPAA